jgi:hypothetical protein
VSQRVHGAFLVRPPIQNAVNLSHTRCQGGVAIAEFRLAELPHAVADLRINLPKPPAGRLVLFGVVNDIPMLHVNLRENPGQKTESQWGKIPATVGVSHTVEADLQWGFPTLRAKCVFPHYYLYLGWVPTSERCRPRSALPDSTVASGRPVKQSRFQRFPGRTKNTRSADVCWGNRGTGTGASRGEPIFSPPSSWAGFPKESPRPLLLHVRRTRGGCIVRPSQLILFSFAAWTASGP